jgi:protein TonB
VPSEVLSETTGLDALMDAILGDGTAAADALRAPAPEPTVHFSYFETEALQNAGEIAFDTEPGGDLSVAIPPQRTWRDLLFASSSKQWAIVGGLLAGTLISVSAISLRGEPTQSARRSFKGRGLMASRTPVRDSGALRPRLATEAEIRLPSSKSDKVPAIEAPREQKRANRPTDDRTTSISVKTRDVSAPLTWPIVMAPDTLEGVAGVSDDVSTPAELLSGGAAEYPDALRSAGIGGSVEVRFTIAANGEILDVRSTTGPPQLRSIAEAAVRRWRYQAARIGNRPVETQTSVHFYFDPSAKIAPQ